MYEKRKTVTLQSGGTDTLEVDVDQEGTIITFIDDGAGNAAATYDLLQEVYSAGFNDWQFYDEVTGETARSWQDEAIPQKHRATIANQSGGQATYRIRIVVLEE